MIVTRRQRNYSRMLLEVEVAAVSRSAVAVAGVAGLHDACVPEAVPAA